jgi:hypothetical protein
MESRSGNIVGEWEMERKQGPTENCTIHNYNFVPTDKAYVLVSGNYQAGIAVVDFTDPANAQQIAYADPEPLDPDSLVLGGSWSAYWYNGRIYASEIARGLDVLELRPSAHLSQNELDAAKTVRMDYFNVQDQQRIVWPPSAAVARAYLDQLRRNRGLSTSRISAIAAELDRAERLSGTERQAALTALATALERDAAGAGDPRRLRAIAAVVRGM